MYIKRISINGFKTYRSEITIDLLSPHCNLILGKNGSGKSNLLDAIQFVLSDKYLSLTAEERKLLLYTGAGGDATAADVEIVFDNSDKRIPMDSFKSKDKDDAHDHEVRIRRTIGLKKDQILINSNPFSNADFQNLLESAGLSRNNPYYIVQQGRINALMKQKKSERLGLLQEIAGTRMYDERRAESQKIMRDTTTKSTQVEVVLVQVEKKLEELQEDEKELKKFMVADTNRRSLEYSIYEQEREAADNKLKLIDQKRGTRKEDIEDGTGAAEQKGLDTTAASRRVTECEDEINQLSLASKKAAVTKKTVTASESSLMKRKTVLELIVKDFTEKIASTAGGKDEATKQLATLMKKIKETKDKLERVSAEYTSIADEEEKCEISYQRLDQRVTDLSSKRTRSTTFSTKAARDADLKKQIAKVSKMIGETQRQHDKLQKDNDESTASIDKTKADIATKDALIVTNRTKGDAINVKLQKLTDQLAVATAKRKQMWSEEARLASEHASMAATRDKAERAMQQSMDKDTFRGLQSVRAITDELRLNANVFGPVIELFTCAESFYPAVEQTAGGSLFNVVVDTDATAARLIKELTARKGGRITFTPLNSIHTSEVQYPVTTDAMPMKQHLVYQPEYEAVFQQIFGKTLIVRDMQTGSSMAHQYGLNTITMSGDRVDKKGAMTGGFIADFGGRSRLASQAAIAQQADQYARVQNELEQAKSDIAVTNNDIEKINSEIAKLTDTRLQLRNTNATLTQDIVSLKKDLSIATDAIARGEKLLPTLRASLASIETQLASLKAELASAFASGLTPDEESELKTTLVQADDAKKQLLVLRKRKGDAESSKAEVQSLLTNNLYRREAELNAILNGSTQQDVDMDDIDNDKKELEQVIAQLKEMEVERKKAEAEIERSTAKMTERQNELEALRTAESDARAALSEDTKTMDRLLNQRLTLQNKRDEAMRKIRDLGALPSSAFDRYKDATTAQLFKRLEKTQAELKKMPVVNKKAAEQMSTFTEERNNLVERKTGLDKERTSIMELIDYLDGKKDEAIERTFKAIAKHFSEVFAELVPGGKAQLIMETKGMDDGEDTAAPTVDEDDADNDEEEKKSSSRSKKRAKTAASVIVPTRAYTGLKIQSAQAQFICSTFHPEMLHAADKCYGVVFQHSTTVVKVITEDEAMKLIVAAEQEANQAP